MIAHPPELTFDADDEHRPARTRAVLNLCLPEPLRVEEGPRPLGGTRREWYPQGFISDHRVEDGVEGTSRVEWFAAYKPVSTVTGFRTTILAGPKTAAMRSGFSSREDALAWLTIDVPADERRRTVRPRRRRGAPAAQTPGGPGDGTATGAEEGA